MVLSTNMKRKGHWTIKGSKVIYQNNWLKLTEDVVIPDGGKEGVYATLAIKPGVSVLALDDEGLMAKSYH